MSFTPAFARDTEEVIAVVEVWRQFVNKNDVIEYAPVMKVQPYYKAWISEKALGTNKNLFINSPSVKKSVGTSLLTAQYSIVDGVKGFALDLTNQQAVDVLGVQIDTASKYGARAEIAFADKDGLIFKTLRTNDIIFIWLIDMKDSNWAASMGGSVGAPIYDKAMLAMFYEKSPDLKVDWKKDFKKANLLQIRTDAKSMLNKGQISSLADRADRAYDRISSKFKGRETNRPRFPSFAGFLTVKRRHQAKTGQFRALCQDTIRYFQHFKINLKAEENENYLDTPFYKLILDPLLRDYYANSGGGSRVYSSTEHEKRGAVVRQTHEVEIFEIDVLDLFNAMLDLSIASSTGQKMTYFNKQEWNNNRNVWYHIMVDDVIRDKIVRQSDTIYIKYRTDVTTKNIETAEILSEGDNWLTLDGNDLKVDQFEVNDSTETFLESLDAIQGSVNTSGVEVEKDPSDIYSSINGGKMSPSLFDLFETYVHNIGTKIYKTRYNVRRSVWSKSFSFISSKAFVSLFHFRFCGRDLETFKVLTSKNVGEQSLRARHHLHRRDIEEMDIWEVNTQLTANEGRFEGSDYSVKLALSYDSSSNNSSKIVSFGSGDMKPIRTFSPSTAGTTIVAESLGEGVEQMQDEITAMVAHLNILEGKKTGKEAFTVSAAQLTFSKPNPYYGVDKNSVEDSYIVRPIKVNNSTTLSLKRKSTIGEFLSFSASFLDSIRDATSKIAQFWKGWVDEDGSLVEENANEITDFMKVKWVTSSVDYGVKKALDEGIRKLYEYQGVDYSIPDFVKEVLNYTYVELRDDFMDGFSPQRKKVFTKIVVSVKRSLLQYVMLIIRTGLYAVLKFIHGLTSFGGKNGSLYMSARPIIDIGDEIILWRSGGDGNIRQTVTREVMQSKVGTVAMDKKRKVTEKLDKIGLGGIFRGGDQGKIYYEDYMDNPDNSNYLWYVWKHVVYVGNFGVTSGFTSKIYITDEPIHFGIQFLDDNVITKQLANFLFESGLGGQYPQEVRRVLGT